MRDSSVSVKIGTAIAFIAVAALGGWLAYLATNAYWQWRIETESHDLFDIQASTCVGVMVGAVLAVCALWALYERPKSRARRTEALRLGSSRSHRTRV